MPDGLAIVAGRGDLPRLIAEQCERTGRPYRVVRLPGMTLDWVEDHPVIDARFERPGQLFVTLRQAGCGAVTFAGGLVRPRLRPLCFDLTMWRAAPRLLAAVRSGDDAALRAVASVFERAGLRVEAPHALLPQLAAVAGVHSRALPDARDRADAARAAAIVAAMGSVDVGQATVVAQGICLGIESIQGTDMLLDFVARTGAGFRPDPAGARGLLFKAPKPGQDRRLDLPAIGPETVQRAAAAGLGGVVVEAGGVMILDHAASVAAADAAGLFLWAREP
jgi:UDP-2,3-diacylglucosamine hydrolase